MVANSATFGSMTPTGSPGFTPRWRSTPATCELARSSSAYVITAPPTLTATRSAWSLAVSTRFDARFTLVPPSTFPRCGRACPHRTAWRTCRTQGASAPTAAPAGRAHPTATPESFPATLAGMPGRCALCRWRSTLPGVDQGAADCADVDDSGDAGVVADDRQVAEVTIGHQLARLAEAGSGSDDGRVRGHHIGDPDVVDVLAVGDDMSDVGVGDNPYRLVSPGVEDHQGRGTCVFHQVCSRGNVIGDSGRGQRRLHDLGHTGWALRPGGTRSRCFCHDPSVSGLRWCRRPKAWTRHWQCVLRHCAGSQSVVSPSRGHRRQMLHACHRATGTIEEHKVPVVTIAGRSGIASGPGSRCRGHGQTTTTLATGLPLGWSRASNAPQGGGSDGRDH